MSAEVMVSVLNAKHYIYEHLTGEMPAYMMY
jgi:hypothetical protein